MLALRDGCRAAIEALHSEGNLAPEWTPKKATDALWTMLLVPNWKNLTGACGWSTRQYVRWMKTVARYNEDGPWENFIHVYNTLTGSRLSVSPEYDFPSTWDEIEGLSIHPLGMIYVAVTDNDWPSDDEFEIHAFKYPNSYKMNITTKSIFFKH